MTGSMMRRLRRPRSGRRASRRELALFTRSLARLLAAGLPLADALRLAGSVPGGGFSGITDDLCAEVRAGQGLAGALQHIDQPGPPVFGAVYVALAGAAEAGGALEHTLNRLADYLERAEKLAQSVRSALVYPALLLGAAFLSLLVLLLFVAPRYEALFAGAGQQLPLLTRVVLGGAGVLRSTFWLIPLAALAGVYYWRRHAADPVFRAGWEARLLALPVTGALITKIALERSARTLAELIANGVALPDALLLTAETAGYVRFAEAWRTASARVREGAFMSQALAEQRIFPEMLIQLVRVGEESGGIDVMLSHLAGIYALDVEAHSARLIALLEPVLILLIGVVMAVVIIALISAIMSVNDLAVI